MKAPEELNALKEEVEALNKKLAELTKEELLLVCGGFVYDFEHKYFPDHSNHYNPSNDFQKNEFPNNSPSDSGSGGAVHVH